MNNEKEGWGYRCRKITNKEVRGTSIRKDEKGESEGYWYGKITNKEGDVGGQGK